ncbi:unnamed protein product [Protopolystoma xenopodis]|uniref:Uncharacterized protein n=1 Tax=Protopolystoma xenopodis TaxID=117903 RepID=A0A3S5A7V7_9PLAT|nr:unnamed protein product [Protopolystoma xenopodis]
MNFEDGVFDDDRLHSDDKLSSDDRTKCGNIMESPTNNSLLATPRQATSPMPLSRSDEWTFQGRLDNLSPDDADDKFSGLEGAAERRAQAVYYAPVRQTRSRQQEYTLS